MVDQQWVKKCWEFFYKTLALHPITTPASGGEGRLYVGLGAAVLFLSTVMVIRNARCSYRRWHSFTGDGYLKNQCKAFDLDRKHNSWHTSEVLDIVRINPTCSDKNFFLKWWRQQGVYPKTRSLIFQVDLPSLKVDAFG